MYGSRKIMTSGLMLAIACACGGGPNAELTAQPGGAWLVHRHALHGIAPWSDPEAVSTTPRMIIYFRPEFTRPQAWLSNP